MRERCEKDKVNIGIVMKVNGEIAIVMSDHQEFVAIKNKPGLCVGQKIKYSRSDIIKNKSGFKNICLLF